MIQITKDLFIKDKNNNPIKITTPPLYLPFGLEKEYDSYYLKLQLRKTHDNKYNNQLSNFLKKIEDIENALQTHIGKPLKSQIKLHEKYDPIIITKIPFLKDKPLININDKHGIPFNIFNIKKGSYMICYLKIDRAFLYKDTITYKIKNTDIKLL